jgi:hypothetical protein
MEVVDFLTEGSHCSKVSLFDNCVFTVCDFCARPAGSGSARFPLSEEWPYRCTHESRKGLSENQEKAEAHDADTREKHGKSHPRYISPA